MRRGELSWPGEVRTRVKYYLYWLDCTSTIIRSEPSRQRRHGIIAIRRAAKQRVGRLIHAYCLVLPSFLRVLLTYLTVSARVSSLKGVRVTRAGVTPSARSTIRSIDTACWVTPNPGACGVDMHCCSMVYIGGLVWASGGMVSA